MSSRAERALLFDLRCRTRREVAEALLLCAGAGSPASGPLLRRYLAALDSAAALEEVRAAAHELTGRGRPGKVFPVGPCQEEVTARAVP